MFTVTNSWRGKQSSRYNGNRNTGIRTCVYCYVSMYVILELGQEKGVGKTQLARFHVTEPNADAAASCGDDDLSQKYKLERRDTKRSEKCRRADLHTTRHAPLMAKYQQRWSITSRYPVATQEWFSHIPI